MSVNVGQTVNLKINTDATDYRIEIFRLGYYGGAGARKIATSTITLAQPQAQPACVTDPTTGLVDCGTWAHIGDVELPPVQTSGIYLAKLTRIDGGIPATAASHIVFVVRDDARHASLLFQTVGHHVAGLHTRMAATSLYVGGPVANPPVPAAAGAPRR